MKIKTIIACMLLSCIPSLSAIIPFDYSEQIEPNRIYDFVQHACSQRLGKRFHTMSVQERKVLYNEIQNILYGPRTSLENIDKKTIYHATDQVLIQRAGKYMYELALNSFKTPLYSHHLRHLYEQHVMQQCSCYPTAPLFETYFNDSTIQQYFEKFNQEKYSPSSTTSSQPPISDRIVSFFDWLFSSTPSLPTSTQSTSLYPSTYEQSSIQQPQTPAPSAPSYANVNKLFPQTTCSMCLSEFTHDNLESFFLPCGHNFCRDCIGNWFFAQAKSTCPLCNYVIKTDEKNDLKNSMTQTNICCLCNKKSTYLNHLNYCTHTMCQACTNRWVNQSHEFSSHCPRCYKSL